ncbi:hypothetical protein ABFZ85_06515 [Hyphococcus formosus]|uniref:hypothetical protein n=1 Tax=Hyphococcus formosus TaxID=3143534 RepID=UPI00398B0415
MVEKNSLDSILSKAAKLSEAEFGLSRGDLFLATRPTAVDSGDWRCARETFAFIAGYLCDQTDSDYEERLGTKWKGRLKLPNRRAISLLLEKKPSYLYSIRNIWKSLAPSGKIIESNSFDDLIGSLKKEYRKRKELPDPSKKAWDEINRTDARYQARISQDTLTRVQDFLKASGASKKEFTEQALNELLDRLEAEK